MELNEYQRQILFQYLRILEQARERKDKKYFARNAIIIANYLLKWEKEKLQETIVM